MNLNGFVPNGIYTLALIAVAQGVSSQKKTPFTELTLQIAAPETAKYDGKDIPVTGVEVRTQIYWTEKAFARAAETAEIFGIVGAAAKGEAELKELFEKAKGAFISAAITSKPNVLRESLTPEDLAKGLNVDDKPAITDPETKQAIVLSWTKDVRQFVPGSLRFPGGVNPFAEA